MIRGLPIVLALFAVSPAFSQTLQVSVVAGSGVSNVLPGSVVPMASSAAGVAAFATVTVRYTGSSSASLTGLTVTGTNEMSISIAPALPVVLAPNNSTSFTVQYLPVSGNNVTGQVSIAYTESSQASNFAFFLSGSAPNLTYSYSLAPGASATLQAGGRIAFPVTNTGSTATATVTILNGGTASALQSVSVAGTAFQLPASPGAVQIQSGQQVSFNVVFAPQAAGDNQGTLTVAINNATVTFALSGTATAPNFAASYTLSDGVVHPLTDGTQITLPPVDINATSSAAIDLLNQGTGTGTITGISLTGAGFRLTGAPLLPASVAGGQAGHFGIVFAPAAAGTYTATFRIDLSGRSISGTVTASTAPARLTMSYLEPDTNNTLPLQDGSSLSFPKTLVNGTSSITVVVGNTGTGTGFVNSIALGAGGSAAFQLLNVPALPASVAPNQTVRFGIRFSPQQQQAASAPMLVDLNGQLVTVTLQAQGTGPQFTYTSQIGSATAALSPGASLALGDVTVGSTSTVSISIANGGTADGQISAIGITGQGLSLTDLPALPLTLHPADAQHFTVTFAPTQPGSVSGRLTIGGDTFTITGNGIGSRLVYSYTNTAATTPVSDSGVVIFAPLAVGSSESVSFSIENTGTSAATISTINLTAQSAIFALRQVPSLPLNLNPGDKITFPISFSPDTAGSLSATLRVNVNSFTLSGTGMPPASLPSYQFQGLGGTQQAAQQPPVGLSLSSPYPLPLQGILKLSFVSSVFVDDPSVQFATGGRTVAFTIPANSKQAVFAGNAATIPIQTGTTAGDIVITPSFATQGGFDLTPSSPPALTLTVARGAPQLLNATVSGVTATSFSITLSGYSTPRSLRQLDIQVAPKPGANFAATHLTIDISSAASAWFQGSTSQAFGGSFLVGIPFNLQNGSSTDDLVHRIQSLSITATNDTGGSSAIAVTIP